MRTEYDLSKMEGGTNRFAVPLGRSENPVKTQQALRAAGLATFKQKIVIGKMKDGKLVTPQYILLGIARKLINLDRKERPSYSQITTTKDIQSFLVELNNRSWFISSARHNNVWVVSNTEREKSHGR